MNIRISLFFIAFLLSGCIKDVLDRKPLNIISETDLWESRELVDVYLVALYDAIPIGFAGVLPPQSTLTDEATYREGGNVNNFGNQAAAQNTDMYSWIRRANYFLEQIETSSLNPEEIALLSAECHFIRAYYYFDLAKKYGGMPIIDEVQDFDNNLEDLQVSRDTEDALYEFIASELDIAIEGLPDEWDDGNANRATKWTALALKSRAMLYAGSIAKYGSVQLQGVVGIPAEKAGDYFRRSLQASAAIMDGGKFSLYTVQYDPASGSGNPAQNYQNIFLDENNSEIIFQKAYSYPDKAHSFDNYNIPEGYTTNNGSGIIPTLEIAEAYRLVDGSSGVFEVADKEFATPDELFQGKDPRFEATILRTGNTFAHRPVEVWRGIYDQDGTLYQSLAPFPADPSRNQVGRDGPFSEGNFGKTGFYLKKYMNTATAVVEAGQSDQNYIDIRYAEILLNFAEAAYELEEEISRALEAVNLLRARAGIAGIAPADFSLGKIREERRVELAFEDKRFWDIRRWRIGTQLFRNTYLHGLWPYLRYENGVYTYVFEKVSGYPIDEGFSRIFNERDYYSNLSGYINTNNNIVNNPGW